MKVFVFTDNVNGFFIDNQGIDRNYVHILRSTQQLRGIERGKALILIKQYRESWLFKSLKEEIEKLIQLRDYSTVVL